jgi:hypothetical protein
MNLYYNKPNEKVSKWKCKGIATAIQARGKTQLLADSRINKYSTRRHTRSRRTLLVVLVAYVLEVVVVAVLVVV